MADEFSITLADQPVLLDFDRQVADLLDDYLRMDAIPRSPHQAVNDERFDLEDIALIKLPRPNYPPSPLPRINELYWPTGAARWAQGWLLMDGERFNKITSSFLEPGSAQTAATLKVTRDQDDVLTCQVFPLHPRPVNGIRGSTDEEDESLWIVPIVDQRYFWQFTSVDFSAIDDTTTWSQLYTQVTTSSGIAITADTIHADYLKPDTVSFQREDMNVAVALDAIAHSIGHRIIADYDGTVRSLADDARYETNTSDNGDWSTEAAILGDPLTYGPTVPGTVVVSFRRANGNIPSCDRDHHQVEIAAANTTHGVKFPHADSQIKHTIASTQWALFDDENDTTANNQAALAALAQKIAEDYYAKFTNSIDQTAPGIIGWQMSANDDFVQFSFGTEVSNQPMLHSPEGGPASIELRHKRILATRVCSIASNFGTRHQLSNDADVLILKRGGVAKTTSAISAASDTTAGSGTASLERLGANNAFVTWKSGVTIYNSCEVGVPLGVRIQYKVDKCGVPWVDVECCDNGGS